MFTGVEIVAVLTELGFTHVVWVPDSTLGTWEQDLASCPDLRLIRVCREGEAWPLAAGLYLGGKQPLVMMQTTGLFESGDAMRNVLFDLQLPILALVGARSWLVAGSRDSARRFTEPLLRAWGTDYTIVSRPSDRLRLAEYLRTCQRMNRAGMVLIAEERM